MRKLLLFAFIFFALFTKSLHAQYYFYNDKYYENEIVVEGGPTIGIMNALTDLGGKKGKGKNFIKDLRWKTARPSYGFYVMGMYKGLIGVRLEGTFGEVVGYDSILKNVASSTFGRYERNLSFKSKISEIQLGVEFHPITLFDFENAPLPFSPYIIAGVGRYSFDPKAELKGQWYSLQPLSLEGQGFREYKDREQYQLTQFNIAAGLGLRYEINSLISTRLELVHRFLTTDYLDDVSTSYIDPALFPNYLPVNLVPIAEQLFNRKAEINPNDGTKIGDKRGNPKNNDTYFTIQLKIGVTLGRQKR